MFFKVHARFIRLAFAGLTAATVILSPGIAEAKTHKPPCYGTSCRGKDPAKTGCDRDARTLTSAHDKYHAVRVDLRYSKMCNARWARTTVINGDYDITPYAQLGSGNLTYRTANKRAVWSLMWTGPIKACRGAYVEGPTLSVCTKAR
jgi:hypothetical protein